MINKAILIGRLTKDLEIRLLDNGNTVTSFTLAVDRTFKSRDGEKSTDFIPIVAWGKTAELCGEYLSKGSLVGISGRIQVRSYNANDGSRRYVTEVVAEEVNFLTPKKEQDTEPKVPMDGFNEMDDYDDMPF